MEYEQDIKGDIITNKEENNDKVNKHNYNCFEKICKKYGVSLDLVNWDRLDNTLSYGEQKQQLLEQLKILASGDRLVELRAEEVSKGEIEIWNERARENLKEEMNEQIKEQFNGGEINTNVLGEYQGTIKELIKATIKKHSTGLLLLSEGGVGKTHLVLNTLRAEGKELGKDYVYLNTFSTPLEFYNFLYTNNDKIIILDDVEGLIDNSKGVSILKSALWSENNIERIVSYFSTSDKLKVPQQFLFKGQIICCFNTINARNNPTIKALLSRILFYEINYNYNDKLKMLYDYCEKENYKQLSYEKRKEVYDYLKLISNEATDNFNFRTLMKGYELMLYSPSGWKELLSKLVCENDDKAVIVELKDQVMTEKERVREFLEITGKSRATYFRLKNEMGLSRDWNKRR